MAHNRRNTTTVENGVAAGAENGVVADLGIEPLNARSVVLSSLLGSHPPRQSARSLIALAERFDIRSGTVRTALSRMVAAGELTVDDASYALTGRLLDRQREQDTGRHVDTSPWDRSWWTVIVEADRRTTAQRRAFRASMEGARMAELRPDIWLRPANVPGPPRRDGVIVSRGEIDCDDVDDLVGRLWPLGPIEQRAQRLGRALRHQLPVIESPEGDDALATTFTVAAAAVRFLRSEPQLPSELTPPSWTAGTIRPLYDEFLSVFQRQLRAFFAST